MKEFHSNKEVVFGSKLYCPATEFLLVRSRREMWAAIGDKKRKFQWLKLMFERRSNIKPWCKCKSAIMYLHLFILYFLAIEVDCVFICFFCSITWISYFKWRVVGLYITLILSTYCNDPWTYFGVVCFGSYKSTIWILMLICTSWAAAAAAAVVLL